jgi:hypothetical protein
MVKKEPDANLMKEVECWRERDRSRKQIFSVVFRLSESLIRIAVVYWIGVLAIHGARYYYSDFGISQLAQVIIFALFTLWAVSYLMYGTNVYGPISGDAGIWLAEFTKKFQASSKAWVKTRESLEEKK